MVGNLKRVKHYHEPGDVHELTFSCYQSLPLLTDDARRGYLAESVRTACAGHDFRLIAFVFMPEHVHLLVLPRDDIAETGDFKEMGDFLAGVKRPCSARVKQDLESAGPGLLRRLNVLERPGKTVFRFWQEGPGYDRNLQAEATVLGSIDYIHNNPVRRGLCSCATDWYWSSARYYTMDPPQQDANLPLISSLPPEFFTPTRR